MFFSSISRFERAMRQKDVGAQEEEDGLECLGQMGDGVLWIASRRGGAESVKKRDSRKIMSGEVSRKCVASHIAG
jgi:hypothetical protein